MGIPSWEDLEQASDMTEEDVRLWTLWAPWLDEATPILDSIEAFLEDVAQDLEDEGEATVPEDGPWPGYAAVRNGLAGVLSVPLGG